MIKFAACMFLAGVAVLLAVCILATSTGVGILKKNANMKLLGVAGVYTGIYLSLFSATIFLYAAISGALSA